MIEKISSLIGKARSKRFQFILLASFLLSLTILSLFIIFFLIFPAFFIGLGLIAIIPLLFFLVITLGGSFSFFLYKFPLQGDLLYQAIICYPFSAQDLQAALEIEENKSFPKQDLIKNETTLFLSQQFIDKVKAKIKTEPISWKRLFPKSYHKILFSLVTALAIILSIINLNLLINIFSYLKAGLPVQLLALNPTIKFNKLEALIIPPAYLESDSNLKANLLIHNKIKVMQGSRVIIKGEVPEVIKNGRLILSTKKGIDHFPISVNQKLFESSFLAPMRGAFALEFSLDKEGKTLLGKSKIYKIETVPDQPPKIKIISPENNHQVIFGHPVELVFSASDDFGILEIYLWHRDPNLNGPYHQELIARFPKKPKIEFSDNYVWNPIIKEGKKINQLVYHPNTKRIEYFLEVKDINIFSQDGVTRSEKRYLLFKDVFSDLKKGENLIKELVKDGKDLLNSFNDQNKKNLYKKKLTQAAKNFQNELRNSLPQSSLVNETKKVERSLNQSKPSKKNLADYINFLENYNLALQLMMAVEQKDIAQREVNTIEQRMQDNNFKHSQNRMTALADFMQKNFQADLQKINDLLAQGKTEEAKKAMQELLKKMQKEMQQQLENSQAGMQKMADEVKKKLDELVEQATSLKKEQKANQKGLKKLAKTKNNNKSLKTFTQKQTKINQGLASIKQQMQNLTASYPFIMGKLNYHAQTAKHYGDRSLEKLNEKKNDDSITLQKEVVKHLDKFIQSSAEQQKQLKQMAKGDFQSVRSQSFQNRFVYIPKEAVYTVPVDYKEKIIEMSQKRNKNNKKKENFWRDILE